MIFLFFALIFLIAFVFIKSYYPYFNGADDLFSIFGFMTITFIFTAFVSVIVMIPYYLFFDH